MIPMAKPLIGDEEKAEVIRVLEFGGLAQGREVQALEEAFAAVIGVKHAIATTNGTTALHLALLANGIGPGDEVITVPFTFIASANVVLYCGARPVFVDIEPDTFNMDPDADRSGDHAAHEGDRAGAPLRRARRHAAHHGDRRAPRPAVIEDACQAHGAEIAGPQGGQLRHGLLQLLPDQEHHHRGRRHDHHRRRRGGRPGAAAARARHAQALLPRDAGLQLPHDRRARGHRHRATAQTGGVHRAPHRQRGLP